MKKFFLKLIGISLLFSLVACSNPSSGNSGNTGSSENNENKEDTEIPPEPVKPAPKYIRFAITKAVDSLDDLNSSTDSYWEYNQNSLVKDIAFGCYKNSYTQIRAFKVENELDFDDFSLSGNTSPETKLVKWSYRGGKDFAVLFVAADETSEKVTVTAQKPGDELSRPVDFYICSKKLSAQDAADMALGGTVSFAEPVYIDRDGFSSINKTLSNNPYTILNFDFSNCWFTINEVPSGAFCSPKHEYNSAGESYFKTSEEWGFGNIRNVKLPKCLYKIQMGAFYGCYNLTVEEFPATLISVDFHAFAGCKNIDNATLLPEVSVSPNSFSGSNKITEVSVNERRSYVDAYSVCKNLKTIRVGKDVEEINLDSYTMYGDFVVDEQNQNYKSVNGVLYSKDGTILYKVTNTNCGYSFTVPSTVKEIKSYAITYCKGLREIHIPSSVEKIDCDAIGYHADLKSVYADFPSKPDGWNDRWVYGGWSETTGWRVDPDIYWIGTSGSGSGIGESGESGDSSEVQQGTLSGTYKVSGNERCTLEFTGSAVERFDNNLSKETYTYTLNGNTFVLTSDRAASKNYPGEFEIVFNDKGFVLNKKNDVALSWIGTWTNGKSMETVEFVR